MATEEQIEQYRYFLKDTIRSQINFRTTDQANGIPAPAPQKPCAPDATRHELVPTGRFEHISKISLVDAVRNRQSRRKFINTPLSLEEISFLLWATQGVRETAGDVATFRTVPSAGARHAFETYVYAKQVEGLERALYRYLPLSHELVFEFGIERFGERIQDACFDQAFIATAAAVFVWTAIPYRTEWRYGLAAHKVIAMDAGHLCQNLYLACEAIRAGTCAIGAYEQEKMDKLLHVDGKDEFTIYLAPVGKRKK